MRALAMLERLAGHVTDGAVGAQLAEALMPLLVAKTTRCAGRPEALYFKALGLLTSTD